MAALPVVLVMSMNMLLGAGEGVVEVTPSDVSQAEAVESAPLCTHVYAYYYYSGSRPAVLVGEVSCACGRAETSWGAETPNVVVEHGMTCKGGSEDVAPEAG